MVGKLFIDGLDAFSEYGIFVEQYGYKALVQMPSFKKLSSTEWPEYDGEEVDLSAPLLDSKTFSIPFDRIISSTSPNSASPTNCGF